VVVNVPTPAKAGPPEIELKELVAAR